jgi:pimaricinolide synthase PimS1
VLSLQHERLPKTLHAQAPSRHISWESSGLALLQEARPWPRSERPRRAGVSSFGISGTNAHIIVEEAPRGAVAAPLASERLAIPLLVSGRDEGALREQALRWASWLEARPEVAFADVLRTAAVERTHFAVRAALLVSEPPEAIAALRALGEGRPHGNVLLGKAGALGSVVFVFPGQGSQWPSMGRALWDESSVFCEAVPAGR